MPNSYLAYLGWNLIGTIAVFSFVTSEQGRRYGHPAVVLGELAPWVALGALAGLLMVMLLNRSNVSPLASGTLAYVGAVVVTLAALVCVVVYQYADVTTGGAVVSEW